MKKQKQLRPSKSIDELWRVLQDSNLPGVLNKCWLVCGGAFMLLKSKGLSQQMLILI